MKNLTRDGVENLIPYPPGKPIEELERELGISGSIKLASNENPIGPSPKAVRAIMDRVNTLNRYPDGSGYYLKKKLCELHGVPLDQIIIGNGSNELIELIVRTFLSPGENVVQAFPGYLMYEKIVTGAGGQMKFVPLSDLNIDLRKIRESITRKTKIVIICNPNNPTGLAISKDDMKRFLRDIPKDVIVTIDEAYIEFVSGDNVADGLELLKDHPLLMVLRTFSKLYGLAGLRIGYGFAAKEIVDYMNRVRQPFNVNSLAQIAATAALEDVEFVTQTQKLVKDGLGFLYKKIDEMGLEYIPTQTNFFLIKVPGGAKKIYDRMLREGVIIRSMESYGLPDYVRINVGLQEENERFVETLKKVLGHE